MKTHNLQQGTAEWLAYRAQHFNASDAPAMMGCSPYKTRAELLREMHTGVAADVDIATQKRFDNGHRAEALARPLAEEIVGAELYPVTGSLGRLSASFDGLTMEEAEGFEHKALNDALRAAFAAISALSARPNEEFGWLLPLHHRVQMEQQLHVSGAQRILFMASEWTADGDLVEQRHVWYYPDEELRAQILAGWDQFACDLAAYVPPPAVEPAPTGRAPETLPALRIEITGAVTASNLAEFKATALGAIRAVNRDLTTDQDFADAAQAVKWCEDVESRLDAAKQHALSQTASIDALFRTIDEISAEARRVRLDLDKLVTRRKTEVRDSAVSAARRALDAHIATLNAELAPMRLPTVAADFAGAIKGKRSIASMQDALDSVLTVAKIAAEADARAIRANLATYNAKAEGYEFLFIDLSTIVHKAADDFAALLDSRIAAHQAAEERKARERAEAEARRQAAEQQRLAEEQARVTAEAERRAMEAAARAAQQQAAQILQQLPKAVDAGAIDAGSAQRIGDAVASLAADSVAQAAKTAAAEPATLTLGAICDRLQFTVRAEFLLDVLHIKPAATPIKGRGLYTESQFRAICRQLQSHISAMAELYAPETA